MRKAFADVGAAPDALATLVDRRLLRIEERLDVRRVELTHDVLCSVVRASRNLRHEREARDEAERKLADQRARERATRKALVRARQIAAVCAVLAIGAAASALFGYVSMKRAQRAEAQALETRTLAESARGEAEKLIVYLLDDFYLELEPVGRLDIVAALAKRAVDYYAALPPALRSTETDRNRALALVRYGAALRNQSRLDESGKALSDAVDVLGKLRGQGDRSEATAIGLGLGLSSQARVASSQNRLPEALDLGSRAVEVLKPLMSASSPSVRLRRAYGLASTFLGFAQGVANENEAAVKTLKEARDAYRSIDALKLDDVPAATAYAEASSWQMTALSNLGRFDELRQTGDDALKVTRQVLERHPGDMSALRSEGLILDVLAGVEWTDLHVRKALELGRQDVRDWEAMVRLDPSNQIAWNNLVNARMQVGGMLLSLGEVREAREQTRAALGVENTVKESAMIGTVLSLASGYLTRLEADAGDRQAAAAALASNQRFVALAIRAIPDNSFGRAYLPEFLGNYGYPGYGFGYGAFALPVADGDYEAVRRMAHASAKRLEQIKIDNASQQDPRNAMLNLAYWTAADASYRLTDYAAADADMQRALALRKLVPVRTLSDQRDAGNEAALAVMIAARLGRDAEAQRLLEPVLELHRGLYARKDNEDLTQHVEFAQALYASALAGSARKTAELKQAAALIDQLPPAMRGLISVRPRARVDRRGTGVLITGIGEIRAHLDRGAPWDACDAFRGAIGERPNDGELLYWGALAHARAGAAQVAHALLDKAQQATPSREIDSRHRQPARPIVQGRVPSRPGARRRGETRGRGARAVPEGVCDRARHAPGDQRRGARHARRRCRRGENARTRSPVDACRPVTAFDLGRSDGGGSAASAR